MTMDTARRARLQAHLRIIDEGVAPVVDRYGEHVECRPGCSDCCHQTFRVSELEGALLREGLGEASAQIRAAIVARAQAYRSDERMPCPALSDDGRCQLYAHRPRICRKYGIPLWNPEKPHQVTTCHLNFRGVTDIDAETILDPQADWARDWLQARAELGLGPQQTDTIAAWLAADED